MKYSRRLFLFFFLFLLFACSVCGLSESAFSAVTEGKTEVSSLREPLYFDRTELVFDASGERYLWSVRPEDFPLSPSVRTSEFSGAALTFAEPLPALEDLR